MPEGSAGHRKARRDGGGAHARSPDCGAPADAGDALGRGKGKTAAKPESDFSKSTRHAAQPITARPGSHRFGRLPGVTTPMVRAPCPHRPATDRKEKTFDKCVICQHIAGRWVTGSSPGGASGWLEGGHVLGPESLKGLPVSVCVVRRGRPPRSRRRYSSSSRASICCATTFDDVRDERRTSVPLH
jgi:hypothetical protein